MGCMAIRVAVSSFPALCVADGAEMGAIAPSPAWHAGRVGVIVRARHWSAAID
jgi:hypothetical protein